MKRLKVALLVNVVAPNRVRLYEHLASHFDLLILHGKMEANRSSWKEPDVAGARVRRMAGWQLMLPKRDRGQRIDTWFLHVEPSYLSNLLREQPDAIISCEMGFRTCVALIYGAVFGKPVWIWWGGTLHTERNVDKLRRFIRRVLAKWAKNWISYGLTSTEYLQTLGISRERITQIQNGVDESWYTTPAKPALDIDPKPVLLHVGQMIARKGVTEFLRAAAQLQQEGREFSIVLVGGGLDGDHIKRLASELGLRNIHFYPAQPPNALPSFYRSADVLVFPTLEDVWGLVANEALLSGVQVLCSQYAGCAAELFDPEAIFDPLNKNDFVNAMRRAVDGKLPRPDCSRLKDTPTVAKMMIEAISSPPAAKTIRISIREHGSRATSVPYALELRHSIEPAAHAFKPARESNRGTMQELKPRLYITTSWDDGHPLDLRIAELLDKYGLPGTFYLPLVNEHPLLTHSQIRQLGKSFEIGAHTITHCDLLGVNDDVARTEITGCKEPIEQIVGGPCTSFCFPYGHFRRRHIKYLQDAGYQTARTVEMMSTGMPRICDGITMLATTSKVGPSTFGTYERNALRRLRLGNLLRCLRYRTSDWVRTTEALLKHILKNGGVFHLWGHSREVADTGQWANLEHVFALLAQLQHEQPVTFLANGGLASLCNAPNLEAVPCTDASDLKEQLSR